ncbi:MAG: hypothetical protein B7X31_04910 [Thiomonas sp. 13-66-29]|jgi:predicted 3-demethylubiquinone-9 3-methyltransferase (glyoxalase superfamily)|uniref:VOC family protein n=1 Tax=Thiomonas sp. TaxID=2047785 RepID=UPI000BC598F0|nr:VOC family protein [Thiomonas sp.]OZB63927.1 MAG: hypothetical protein B7X31_04910 [Thiomonas sp. 13-66-29]
MPAITPMLWFDGQAEEAARFYVSIFPNSRIARIHRYPDAGREVHGHAAGAVMVVAFELDGQPYTALNGGPQFRFSEAVSFVIDCADQREVDHYWSALSAGGPPDAQQCGWLKDRWGVSWQVVPRRLLELLGDPDPARAARTMLALLPMKKLDIAALERAAG